MKSQWPDRFLAVAGVLTQSLVYITMLLPPIIVVGASLTAGNSMVFPPEGLSLRWYHEAFQNTAFMNAFVMSLELGFAAMFLSLAIGFAGAYGMDRYRFFGRETLRATALSPLIVPVVVLGIGLLQLLTAIGFGQTFFGLLIGHVIITLPYVVRTLTTSLALLDRSYEEAAANLRAAPHVVLRRVTLPLLLPGFLSAGIFAFVISFGNITLSIFLGFAGAETLPVQIFTYVEHSYDPTLAAVSTMVIVLTVIIMLAIERIAGMDKVL
ncbi:putative spermidine/putrescine transport system permease protein [Rhodobium orientis]|uniref:ABC transmembrane type-1 domain-containing protein n=1 Tax=Rhodobium orientis TaxID=34017 RepID=A0A327JLX7_9HYPH|nr:ABC transporter permease [Rhodobium orientis]MBB4303215.1 putative spermidine/putrescine transport system permease protein [Rhodobium orientis]MBK5951684.1 hypothetical protein [Rhodobium orientis]RAI25842.1 hypothetical protein CH339_16530 [Rhodobium orientis]